MNPQLLKTQRKLTLEFPTATATTQALQLRFKEHLVDMGVKGL